MESLELPPIRETPEDFDRLEVELRELFRKEIYLPLLKELNLKPATVQNALDDLVKAISSGRITFYRGNFKGRFSATTSRELKKLGATWDRKQGQWKVPLSQLPVDVRTAIGASSSRFDQMAHAIDQKLQKMLPGEIADKLKTERFFDATIFKTNKKIEDQLRGITVAPQLTDNARARIAREYTENLKLYVKKFTEEETLKLREQVRKSAFAGNRYENLVEMLQKSYAVSINKAKFLARQETSLLMSKFKESRYRDAGSQQYRWRCVVGSPKHPVRPYHKRLDGTLQDWSSPPIIDEQGHRKHPGEDYNCRCVARPILKFTDDNKKR